MTSLLRTHGDAKDETARAGLRNGLPRRGPAILVLATIVGLLVASGAGGVGAAVGHPSAGATSDSAGVWAWGALANTSYQSENLGAYIDTVNSTTGNVTSSAAISAEMEVMHALYATYTLVNATAPSTAVRSINVSSVAVANYSNLIVVAGNLPAAGTYGANATIPLVNTTSVYWISERVVDLYLIHSNYTLVNGSLALANEHIMTWSAVNVSTVDYSWPVYTANPNGTETVAYVTAGWAAVSWAAASVHATFAPALTLAKAPLSVGESWNDTTNASVVGWSAYAVATATVAATGNTSTYTSGVASLNASAPLGYSFDVVGSETVVFPNGTTGTAFTVDSAQQNGTAVRTYTLWDGLVLIPAGTSAPPAATPHASPLAVRQAPTAASSIPPSQAIVTSNGFPVAAESTVSTGRVLSAAPLSSGTAQAQIGSTAAPTRPGSAVAPTPTATPAGGSSGTTSTPPSNGGGGSSSPPPPSTTPPASLPPARSTSADRSFGLTVEILATLVVAIAVGFVAMDLVRSRTRKE